MRPATQRYTDRLCHPQDVRNMAIDDIGANARILLHNKDVSPATLQAPQIQKCSNVTLQAATCLGCVGDILPEGRRKFHSLRRDGNQR